MPAAWSKTARVPNLPSHSRAAMAKQTRTAVPTIRAARRAMAPSHPPSPLLLLLLEKALKLVEAKKKEEDDKEKKEKELVMEINRFRAEVEDAVVKRELIKLRDWVFKEAMTGRGGPWLMLSFEWPICPD